MATGVKAQRPVRLSEDETLTSFEDWKNNLIFYLNQEKSFTNFLKQDATWKKATKADPNRGFADDGAAVAEAVRQSAEQKVYALEMMLGQIANYAPIINRNTITKQSTSLKSVWQVIQQHLGCQQS